MSPFGQAHYVKLTRTPVTAFSFELHILQLTVYLAAKATVLLLGHLQVSSAASQTIADIPQLHYPIFLGLTPLEKIVTSQGIQEP